MTNNLARVIFILGFFSTLVSVANLIAYFSHIFFDAMLISIIVMLIGIGLVEVPIKQKELSYGTLVRIKEGFYKGMKGRVFELWTSRNKEKEYWVRINNRIFDNRYLAHFFKENELEIL